MTDSSGQRGEAASQSSSRTWLLLVIFGLILVVGFLIAVFFLAYSDDRGVSVVRMEGTLVTGDLSGDGFSAS